MILSLRNKKLRLPLPMVGWRRADERGAAAIIVAGFLTLFVQTFGLVVDGGMQRVTNRSMQGVADITSLDLSRRIDGISTTSGLTNRMNAQLARTRARNGWPTATTITYVLGNINAQGQFVATTAEQVPLAVKVTATDRRDWLTSSRIENSTRTAITLANIQGGGDCIRLGSYEGIIGTPADAALQAFFRTLAQKSSMFKTTSEIGNIDYYSLATQKINLSSVARNLGFNTITDMAKANVPMAALYTAIRNRTLIDLPNTYAYTATSIFADRVLPGAPSMPMSYLLGQNVAGEIQIGLLDLLGGTLAWENGSTNPINPDLSNVPALKNATGTFKYDTGVRVHCAKPGEKFSTSRNQNTIQMGIETNGTLDPVYYPVKFYSPGLINMSTTTGSPSSFKISTSIEPIQMDFSSVSCVNGVKSITVNTYKGDANFVMGESWNVGMNNLNVFLNGYGNVTMSFKAQIGFNATLDFAPKSGITITATKEQMGKPIYFFDPHTALTWNKGSSYFSNFSISGANVSSTDQEKIKTAILNGLITPLLNVDDPNSLANSFIAALLGTNGMSLAGPSIIFDGTDVTCGLAGGVTSVKLVG